MHEGKRLCDAVRFKAKVVTTKYSACHCGMCRRWAGDHPRLTEAGTVAKFAPKPG